jgi:hypothetical protein
MKEKTARNMMENISKIKKKKICKREGKQTKSQIQ